MVKGGNQKISHLEEKITEESYEDIIYTGILAHKKRKVHITAVISELSEENVDHAVVYSLVNLTWIPRLIENSIRGVCVVEKPNAQLLVMGIDGEIEVYDPSSDQRILVENVDLSENGPNRSRWLTSIKYIGTHVYAAGLARQVYYRQSVNKWTRVDQGVFVPSNKIKSVSDACGLWDIDGLREDAIYAVGYNGEIWFYNGKEWNSEEGPTSLTLTCIRCVSEEEVYACGMAGILLRGKTNQWEVIDHDATDQDFWGMAFFKGKLFLSGEQGIFVLDGDELNSVDMGIEKEFTTSYLDAKEGAIWSVGSKDIAVSADGVTWYEVEGPIP